jgi:hypothetical protein
LAVEALPKDHLCLTCDVDGCTMSLLRHGVTEDELLVFAAERGWHLDYGLHYCQLHTIHECSVCGAGTAQAIQDVATGEWTYYCDEHWPL